MAKINTTVRLESELKKDVDKVLQDVGITFADAIRIFARKVQRERRIPFDINPDPFYSEENMAELRRRIVDMKAGRNMSEHEFLDPDGDEEDMAR